MTGETNIRCRARLGSGCHEGEEDLAVENPGLDPWWEDRTYEPISKTIVCDWCFLQLPNNGRFSNLEELAGMLARVLESNRA